MHKELLMFVFLPFIVRHQTQAHAECGTAVWDWRYWSNMSEFVSPTWKVTIGVPVVSRLSSDCVWSQTEAMRTPGSEWRGRGGQWHSQGRGEATRFRKEAELWAEPRCSLPFKLRRLRSGSQLGLASYTIVSFLHSVCIFSPAVWKHAFPVLKKRFYCRATPRKWVGTIPTARTRWRWNVTLQWQRRR